MDTTAGGDLTAVAATLRRRWRVVVVTALSGLLLAVVALLVAPQTFTSTTAVHVRPSGIPDITGEQSGRTNGEVNLDTEAQIASSAEISAAAAQRLGPEADPVELRRDVEVSVPPNSSVLHIDFPAPDRQRARQGSAAFADAYIDYRSDQVDRRVGDSLSALKDEADARYRELDDLTQRAEADPGGRQGRITAVQDEITELNKEIHPLSALRDSVVPAQIVTPATTPEAATSPVPLLWLAAGGVLGLSAGLATAFAVDRRDHRLHTVRDTQRAADPAVLLDMSDPAGAADTAVAAQHANLAALSLAGDLRPATAEQTVGGVVVLVPGISRGTSSAAAATELAAALGRIGADVLLVRADPAVDGRSGSAAAEQSEHCPDQAGLAEVLLGGAEPTELERRSTAAPGLRILDYGGADAAETLQRPAMAQLIERLRASADYVVVVTAPTADRADAYALARTADAVVAVIELGRTRRGDLTAALTAFASLGARVAGTITVPDSCAKTRRGRTPRAERKPRAAATPEAETAPADTDPVPAEQDDTPTAPTTTPDETPAAEDSGLQERRADTDPTAQAAAADTEEAQPRADGEGASAHPEDETAADTGDRPADSTADAADADGEAGSDGTDLTLQR